jgi:molybdopterin-dependent oxidoreductase alpha subunit
MMVAIVNRLIDAAMCQTLTMFRFEKKTIIWNQIMSKVTKPLKAGGLDSVTSTIQQVVKSKRARENIKNLLHVNKAGGFDCPGCAWGDSTDGMLHFCENGAKAIAWESTDRKVSAEFFASYSVTQLRKQSDYWLEYQGRLCEPLRYNAASDHYEPISWQDAFSLVGKHLNQLASPNEAEFYTSGRASNEASYLYQLFGRSFGTNNFPDCSNMCHEASGVALNASIGVGKGTVVLDDFDAADCIFVYGQNPGTNHPRMMNTLRKAAKQGCKIISINNLKEVALEKFASPQKPLELLTSKSITISHMYLRPKLSGDMAVIRGFAKTIFEKYSSVIDNHFIAEHTNDFKAYKQAVNDTSWEQITDLSGLSKNEIEQAASILAKSKNVISTWAMGLTQHKHSVITIRELSNLHLLLGQLGRKGAGLCPVRGHSNVQGNRTMGIIEKPSVEFIEKLQAYYAHPMPKEHGHNVYNTLKALHCGNSKVLICLGGNLAAAAPDTEYTAKALSNARLNVQISTKLNRSHLLVNQLSQEHDALILPCLGRTELDEQASGAQTITVEDTFSMVHGSAGTSTPASPLCKSEIDIVCEIAHATLGATPISWREMRDDYAKIRELIAGTIDGFSNFNEKIQTPQGFHLSNSAANLTWKTFNGKANFSGSALPTSLYSESVDEVLAQKRETILTLQSLRSHDQYNTTIYGMDDRYRGVRGERNIIFMNSSDAAKLHLEEGSLVSVESIWDDNVSRILDGFKLYFYDIPRGNVAGYYPETNPLVPIDSVGSQSATPTSKSIPVIIRASEKLAPIATT